MEILRTPEAAALAALQKRDTAIAALSARVAGVPARIKAIEGGLAASKAELLGAREVSASLAARKKDAELKLGEVEAAAAKHQRELDVVMDNAAFKALLAEIDGDKASADALETELLGLLDDIEKAASREKALAEAFGVEEARAKERAGAEAAEGRGLAAELEAARAARDKAAAGITPDLLARYEELRAGRAGLAVAAVREAGGKLSCGGCHMALTPQKALDVMKPDTLAVCQECRRLMYHERTLFKV